MARTLLMPGDPGERTEKTPHGVRAAGIVVALLVLAMFGGCATDGESCPVPRAPDGEPEPVELAAGAVPSEGIDALMPPGSEASPAVGGGTEESPDMSQSGGDAPEEGAGVASPAQSPLRVDMVYFHTGNPCGCMAEVEGVIDSSLRTYFPEEMEAKTIRFFSVVSDDPANQDLVRMYGSQQFDLFLVTYEGGRAEATQVYEIWSLLGDNEAIALAVESRVAEKLTVSAQPG